ncbi:Ankyrin repeat and SAM domain-containing protein 1A-like [Oopsacas minuta]|uniref:Ankyrin repeat and SAM domain-containing protein 1A-like n=1 Tax=Oopsacas minuta TaxID=111878 RepID=A0AAV7JHZ9_9METZ|nr:Ankyrin repeat and SAM domain-containing protein 1A-like [Oopsacas minuta]
MRLIFFIRNILLRRKNFRGSYDRTLGFPTDGSYIPLNDRSASVLGCNEGIDRREFVKNCAKHPRANLEDSTRVISIKSGNRVTYYPSIKPEPSNTNGENEEYFPGTSPSVDSSVSSVNNDRSNPPGIAVLPPVPVRHKSTHIPIDTPNFIYPSQSNKREFKPLIPEPVINRPRKKSAPVIRHISPVGDDSCPYPAPLPDPILRKHTARGSRRINTYHGGDYEPANYPNEVGHFSDMSHSGLIPQPGRKTLEKPPPGKPRGNKGYQSGNLTSDTSRSTSPSFSDTQFKPKYFQESRYSPIRSIPYFQPEILSSYEIPFRPLSTSGEQTPQEFLDQKSDPMLSVEDLSMSHEDVFIDPKITEPHKIKLDRNKTLTREDSPPDLDDPEWESIENVLDMVAQISSEIESTTSTEMTSSLSPISVPDLMQSIELPHRTLLLMSNGFDDIGFLAGILTQDDLEDIGIEDIAEIQHILAAVNLLPAPEINTRPSSISQWLIQIGLHQLYHLFTRKGFNTIDDVCHLWDIQLSTVLQIHQLGYRRRILYSLSRIRAASPERNFTPSDSDFYSPPFSLASFSDTSFPMDSSPSSSIPHPPPRKDSYEVTQELWSYYDKHITHSYPRDYSRQVSNMNGTIPQERIKQQCSQPIVQKKNLPPLPPKNPVTHDDPRKPKPFPKPVLANNIAMRKSSNSSFSVKPLRPVPERIGPTGEMREVQTKRSYSQIGMQLKNTVDLMSENTKETLISYIAESLQLQPRVMDQHNSNDNRTSHAIQLPPEGNKSHTSKYTRKDNRHSDSSEFAISPIYQQRIEETGENLPPEAWLNRSDRRYHSIMCHSTPTQMRDNQHNYADENIASFYPEGDKKSNSDNKKSRFGKFRSSKKVIKQNPVYESSSLLQGLPERKRNSGASTTIRVPKPHLSTSTSMPSSSYSLPSSIPIPPTSPAEIRIRSPMVMRRETMSTSLENEELTAQTQNLWVHPINKLTTGSICYSVKFMGTAVVTSLVGKETINITCKKIKEASKRGKNIPSITLSISWKWIKLYSIEKERLIQEHMMHHISYSSQYMEDLRMFAFISRDKKNSKYYCNVFQSPTIEHADEVVHTLGQAFEISYQHLLNAKNTQKPIIKMKPKVNKSTIQSRDISIKFHRSQSVDDVL